MVQENETSAKNRPKGAKKLAIAAMFCLGCALLNFGGSKIAALTGLPLYFDSFGTMFAAAFGGYMPGIIVGYITNLFTSAGDPASVYYCLISVLIALAAGFFAKRGWFSHPGKAIASVFVFAFIGGILGCGVTWCLYGITGDWALEGAALDLANALGVSGVAAQFITAFVFDVIDKAVMVACTVISVKVIPERFKDYIDFSIWNQKPLEGEQLAAVRHTETRGLSLRTKIVAILSVVMITAVAVTVSVSSVMFFNSFVENQTAQAASITELMADHINAERVNDYIADGETVPGYAETEKALEEIRDRFPDLEYVYVYQIDEEGCHVVFDLDTEDTPGGEPGDLVEFDPSFEPYLGALLAGEPIEPIISNDSFGWLLTAYYPIYDHSGKCACYLGVDVSMQKLVVDGVTFLSRIILLFLAFFVLICAITIWIAEYKLIVPVNSIANASSGFAFDKKTSRASSVENLENLEITTADEIENLYQAVTKTSEDAVKYIADANEKAETINRMQENLIMVMADLVESRDKFTGDHVRKTAAYTKVIMEQLLRNGAYADEITDKFITDVYKSAPLHDIGKIVVSDTILNKPGKLTDEEFEIMKNHTTAGEQILADAIGAMSDPGYLDEARRLAKFHHEKWNGSGYPCGLAGEDIPLSARIMAVADVFDALISKRSYKEGMPMDKAFSIIREEAGSHFDPLVARAFLDAEAEVREIAARHGNDRGTAGDIRDDAAE